MSRHLTPLIAVALLVFGSVEPVAAVVRPSETVAIPILNATTPGTDLRIALGRLLGEHAHLLMAAMRSAASADPDFDALEAGLNANTEAIRQAVASVYGDDAGTAFRPIWQRHVDASIAFARASKASDQAAADAAMSEMATYRTEFVAFLKSANRKISGDAEIHALQLHLDQLMSFLGQDYGRAFTTERAAYSHMFDFGDDLARGIIAQFPDRYPDGAVAFSPRATLRLTLSRLLGEHLVLAAAAMRGGLFQRADAAAAADSLNANSADLASAIGRIFGSSAQSAFAELWSRHIVTYLAYIDAVRDNDAGARQATLMSLHEYHIALADFLHGAIPGLARADVEQLISHHVTALINQVDAAAAGDYVRAVTVTREAYAQMFVVGDALGNGIADEFPERFADVEKIPATDTAPGPLEALPSGWLPLSAALFATVLIVVLAAVSRGRHREAAHRRRP